MAVIGWIISASALLAGLALQQDFAPLVSPGARIALLSKGLFVLAFLACPAIWREKPMGIGRKPRIMLCLAMLFALPLVLLPLA